mmetsp:Transcript_27325/g.49149  ORF Transcript_27325/g.49149 Transcript_27325/m.49149 type:complete len:889 (-) Transcript_27325:18-2684(-)
MNPDSAKLKDFMVHFSKRIVDDELLRTMNDDSISRQFMFERVLEMMEESLKAERVSQRIEQSNEKTDFRHSLQSSSGKFEDLGERLRESELRTLKQSLNEYDQSREELSAALTEIANLRKQKQDIETAYGFLENKYVSLGQRVKDVLEREKQASQDNYSKLKSKFKAKLHKIRSSRSAKEPSPNAELQSELMNLQNQLHSERSSHNAKLKDQEARHSENLMGLKSQYEAKLQDIERKYKHIVEASLKEHQEELDRQRHYQREVEEEMKLTMQKSIKVNREDDMARALNSAVLLAKQEASLEASTKLREQIKKIEADNVAELEKLKAKIEGSEDENSQLLKKLWDAESQATILSSKLSSLERKLGNKVEEVSDLNLQIKQLHETNGALVQSAKGFIEEKRHLQSVNEDQKAAYEALAHELAELRIVLKQQELDLRKKLAEQEAAFKLKVSDLEHQLVDTGSFNMASLGTQGKQQTVKYTFQDHVEEINLQYEAKQQKLLEERHLAMEQAIVEKEKADSMFKRIERRAEALAADLKKSAQEKAELLVMCSAKEEELKIIKHKAQKLEETLVQQSFLNESQKLSKQQCFTTLKNAAEEYKSELQLLQKTMQTELMEYRKFMHVKLSEALEEVQKSQEVHRLTSMKFAQLQESKLEEAHQRLNESEVQAESKVSALSRMINDLEKRLQSKEQEIGQHTRALQECREREESLLHQNTELNQLVKMRDDTIDNMLHESIVERERVELTSEEQLKGHQMQARKQLEDMNRALEDLKQQHSQELKRFNEKINHLQNLHRQELADVNGKYQRALADRERDVGNASNQIGTFREELELVEQEVTVLRRKVDSVFSSLENEVQELLQEVAEERRRTQAFKTEKLREVEELRRQLRQVGV